MGCGAKACLIFVACATKGEGVKCLHHPTKKRLCSNIFNLHSVHSINAWRLWGPTLYYVYYPIRFFCVRLCNHFHTRVKDFTHCLIFYSDQCKTLDILLNSTVHIYCILQKWWFMLLCGNLVKTVCTCVKTLPEAQVNQTIESETRIISAPKTNTNSSSSTPWWRPPRPCASCPPPSHWHQHPMVQCPNNLYCRQHDHRHQHSMQLLHHLAYTFGDLIADNHL